uniref:(northern house mosquito) hypothetical protein n=1 Tax=Culex pipiens TaxID=7175 RepID=A0A8D8MR21_CULPI
MPCLHGQHGYAPLGSFSAGRRRKQSDNGRNRGVDGDPGPDGRRSAGERLRAVRAGVATLRGVYPTSSAHGSIAETVVQGESYRERKQEAAAAGDSKGGAGRGKRRGGISGV